MRSAWRPYTGFRPATLNELHRPFRVSNDLTEANAALEPEILSGAEAGWAWNHDRISFTTTALWTRIEDAFVNVTIGQGPAICPRAGFVPAGGVLRQRQNAGIIEAAGLEIKTRNLDALWRQDAGGHRNPQAFIQILTDQPVTHPRFSLNQHRAGWVIFQLLTKLSD